MCGGVGNKTGGIMTGWKKTIITTVTNWINNDTL